jgi:glyoxylase-like metal-dependent hydrolase (beta-lactamase superfamily II)
MTRAADQVSELVEGVALVRDTCNVYVLRSGRDAVAIDFGSGSVLDCLDELGIDRVTDVLVTHHHRDQVQGLRRAVDAGARIWVPPGEADLIAGVDQHRRTRRVTNNYDLREDLFSLREAVPVAGTVDEYRTRAYAGVDVFTLPTPGHTVGSVSYLVELGGRRVAFTGDLLHGAGKVWSLAATQWTYSGVEGQAATIFSCLMLGDRVPDLLLPSHGEPIEDPPAALALTRTRLQELIDLRLERPWDVEGWLRRPWVELSPHFLRNRASFAHSYALLSESGSALIVDWGYDVSLVAWGFDDRQARRPLLESIGVLKREYGVERVDAVVTTHYHDDHVAGLNLLRDVEGTEVWSPANVAPILEDPRRYDLPCLWFEPIPVDRTLALGEPFTWREYELIVGGHWPPREVDDAYLEQLLADGRRLEELHGELLPLDELDLGAEGFLVRVAPYRSTVPRGGELAFEVTVRNPFDRAETAVVALALPDGWQARPASHELDLAAREEALVRFDVTVGGEPARHVPVAADVTVGGTRFGEQADALVDVK